MAMQNLFRHKNLARGAIGGLHFWCMNPISRRELLKTSGKGVMAASLLGLGAAPAAMAAAATKAGGAPKQPQALVPLNRFGRMLQEYSVARLREVEKTASARRAALRTKADAEAYVREVREKIRRSFGPFPEKTPLNARVTGTVERDTYKIENVIFESRP